MKTVRKQDFDTDIFEVPYYRIHSFDEIEETESTLVDLVKEKTLIIDAKIDSSRRDWSALLQEYSFRKVCTQVEMRIRKWDHRHILHRINVIPIFQSVVKWTPSLTQ